MENIEKTLGLILLIMGILFTLTIIGAIIGIPMIIVGSILMYAK